MASKVLFNLAVLLLLSILPASASDLEKINYKNIKDGTKMSLENNLWSTRVNKKCKSYIVKKVSGGYLNYTDFYSNDGDFLFSTATQYEFVNKGRLIGYSNLELKFYEFDLKDGILQQRELLQEEVEELFPSYKVQLISNFSGTNSIKLKKKTKRLKLILLNDTDQNLDNYAFSTNNSQFDEYELRGFINIKKKGMIQFSRFGENTKSYPWYVLLIR